MTDEEKKIAKYGSNVEWRNIFDETWLELAAAYDMPYETMKELSRMKSGHDFLPIAHDIDMVPIMVADTEEGNAKSKKKKQIKNNTKKKSTKKKSDHTDKEKTIRAGRVNRLAADCPPKEKTICNLCNTLVSKRYFHNHIRSRLHTKNLASIGSIANSALAS